MCYRYFDFKWNLFDLYLIWFVLHITLCDQVCQWLTTGRWFLRVLWFPPSIKLTACHDITEILLKLALTTITHNPNPERQQLCGSLYKGFVWLTDSSCVAPYTKVLYDWQTAVVWLPIQRFCMIDCHGNPTFFLNSPTK
jgi:hypothetical protein